MQNKANIKTEDIKQKCALSAAKGSKGQKAAESVKNLHLNYVLACQQTLSTIVENPLQNGPILCKTKPICLCTKLMQLSLLQRIMKMKSFSGSKKTNPNKANLESENRRRRTDDRRQRTDGRRRKMEEGRRRSDVSFD